MPRMVPTEPMTYDCELLGEYGIRETYALNVALSKESGATGQNRPYLLPFVLGNGGKRVLIVLWCSASDYCFGFLLAKQIHLELRGRCYGTGVNAEVLMNQR